MNATSGPSALSPDTPADTPPPVLANADWHRIWATVAADLLDEQQPPENTP